MEAVKPVNGTAMGPEKWRNSILKNMQTSSLLIKRANHSNNLALSFDPLPHQRTAALELSNHEAMRHFRGVFLVTDRMRRVLVAVNDEIKCLLREKVQMSDVLRKILHDFDVNKESCELRNRRPGNIKENADGADDLLNAERIHLTNLKNESEGCLRTTDETLQGLADARDYLSRVLKERERVLELHHFGSKSNEYADTYLRRGMTARLARVQSTSMGNFHNAYNPGDSHDSGYFSNSNSLSGDERRTAVTSREGGVFANVDPLGAYTPDCEAALKQAEEMMRQSQQLRGNVSQSSQRMLRLLDSIRKSVNNGLLRRVAETATMKQQLELAHADNRSAVNRANRCYDYTKNNWAQMNGATLNKYMLVKEKLDRPIIRVFQRHPGTQVPEAQYIIRDTTELEESLKVTNKNIQALREVDDKLRSDLAANSQSMVIDLHTLRTRRRKTSGRF